MIDRYVGSAKPALDLGPEILQTVRVDLAAHLRLGVIDEFMRVLSLQTESALASSLKMKELETMIVDANPTGECRPTQHRPLSLHPQCGQPRGSTRPRLPMPAGKVKARRSGASQGFPLELLVGQRYSLNSQSILLSLPPVSVKYIIAASKRALGIPGVSS